MSTVDPVVEVVRRLLDDVPDPEIPVITIADLGILRDVGVDAGRVTVTITPTYSGCPAMQAIREDIEARLGEAGYADVEVRTVLSPAWTTDWITPRGRQALADFGIAPPGPAGHRPGGHGSGGPVPLTLSVRCPQCGSFDTRELSHFGSTACKALYQCRACREPFDSFKAL